MDDTGHVGRGAHPRLARWRRSGMIAGVLVLAVVGGLLLVIGIYRQEPAPPSGGDSSHASSSASSRAVGEPPRKQGTAKKKVHRALSPSDPVRVDIPSLNVSSSLERLGLDAQRAMQTPRDPDRAGWYEPGPTPGEKGPAVIAGHVTWNGRPSVFFDLAKLKQGDTISVQRDDGVSAQFTVDKVAQYAKDQFPTVDVYRNLDHAGLRLITCAGSYSKADRRYSDNIVVYATLTGTRP